MTAIQALAITRPRVDSSRIFYIGSAALAILLTLIGFHHFFFEGSAYPGRPITPPIRGLVITHGVSMTAWLVVCIVQPILIALGKRRAHMSLGRIGAVVALVALLFGLALAVQSAKVSPPDNRIWGMAPTEFMAVPFFGVLFFATFVGLGLWFRRRPAIHKPMMVLATYASLSAAVSRIDWLNSLYLGTFFEWLLGPFFITQVICFLLIAAQYALTRSIDRWFTIGAISLTAAYALVMRLAETGAWERFASLLIG
jgi:hypothetical protein